MNSNVTARRAALESMFPFLRSLTESRIASNTLVLLGVNLSGAVLGFFIAVMIGRGLGSEGLGRYSVVMAWTFGLGIFAEFGLNTLITRDVARARALADEYLTASLFAKTALSIVFVVALCYAAPYLAKDNDSVLALQLGSILIWFNALFGSYTAVFRAFEEMKPILVLNAGGLALELLGTIGLISIGRGVFSLIALAVLTQGLQILGAIVFVRRSLGLVGLRRVDRTLVVRQLRAAAPFAFAGIVGAIEARANFALLGIFQGDNSVGLFSAASRFTEAAKILPNAFFGAAFPAFAASSISGDRFFRVARRGIFFLSLLAALGLTAVAPILLSLSFGNAFVDAESTLVVLAWSLVPALVNGLTMLFLYARGEENSANGALALSLFIQLVVAIPLIQTFGPLGGAISALTGDIILFLLLNDPIHVAHRIMTRASPIVRTSLPFLVFGIALLFRLTVLHQIQFDGLYGQDPYAYLDYSIALRSAIEHLQVPPPFFWPIGYPALVALLSLLLPMAIAPQAVSVVSSAVCATITFLLTREILGDRPRADLGAVVAALIISSAGQMMVSSLSAMSDATALCAATISGYALARSFRGAVFREKSTRWLALAGFSLGFAIMTRWVYAVLVPVSFFAISRFGSEHWRGTTKRIAIVAIFLLCALIPQLTVMLFYSSHGVLSNAGDLQTVGWNLNNAWQSTISNGDGRFVYSLPIAAFYAQPFAHPSFIFPLLTPLLLIGMWSLRRRRFHLVLLAGWIVGMWIFLSGIAWENPRFSLAFFPPLAILFGVGLHQLLESFPRSGTIAAAFTLGCIVLTFAWGYRGVENFVNSQRGDLELATWANSRLPLNATVLSFSITETLKHRTPFNVIELYNESPESIDNILVEHQPIFALVDPDNINSQWKDLAPEVNWSALQRKASLNSIASHPPYMLFAIAR